MKVDSLSLKIFQEDARIRCVNKINASFVVLTFKYKTKLQLDQ
jgi:hypothetical protein